MLRVGFRKPQHRRFDYQPRFYDPEEEERRRRSIRIKKDPSLARRKTKQPTFIALGLLLVLVFFLYVNMDAVVENAAALSNLFFGS